MNDIYTGLIPLKSKLNQIKIKLSPSSRNSKS